jgi:hypothetical protein
VQHSTLPKNRVLAQHRILTLALGLLLGSSLAATASAQGSGTISQLFAFAFTCNSKTNSCPDGANSNPLIQASDGNFYGTTQTGVSNGFKEAPSSN